MEQQSTSQDGKSGSEVVMNNSVKSNNVSDGDATKKKTEQLPNGLHMKQGNGIKEKQGTPMVARFYSRKRGRETTPEIVIKKPKVSERVVTEEEKITDTLGRTADMLLVLAGLGQMRAGRPPSATEVQLAVDAQTNLKSLVARVAPSSLLSKKSLENMLETMSMRLTAENKIEAVARPQIEKPKVEGEEADSDSESSDSMSAKDDAAQNPSGASPGGLFLDDEAEADLKQNDDEEEFQDDHSQLMRHKQLVKIVQQLKAESYVPQPMAAVSNAYMNTVAPCMICHVHVKDTTSVVVCDGCEKVYHQKCLPHNYLRFLPKGDWSCPKCVLDGGGKLQPPKYGPVRKGIPAANKVTVKQQPETKQSMGVPQQTVSVVANGPSAASAEQQLLKQNQQVGGKTAMPNTGHAVGEVADKNAIANNTEKAKSDSANSVLAVPQTSVEDMLDEAVAGASSAENENTQPIPGQPICLHVDWIGEPEQVTDGKAYYSSCCVGGSTYKLQDCALFRPETPDIPPYIARLQVLWEELETGAKWVRVNWCYYPNDMPSVAGRPDMPESDEVYESNHCDNNLVGSIQGPCQVLLPSKYFEEKQRRAKLQASGFTVGDLPPIFLCRWTYDAPKGVFRKVAEGA